jgi:HK97 family phage prohead protease
VTLTRSRLAINTEERRGYALGETDFRLVRAAEDAPARFTGHAAVFNVRTAIGNPLTWGFYEEVAAGAFTKTLQEGDARFLVDHDTSLLVARASADDLRLAQDKTGLAVDADLDTELSYVRDLVRNLEKRRITGMSFGFRVIKDEWNVEQVTTSDGQAADVEVRTLLEVQLFEVSTVTFPAYEETDAALRALRARAEPDPLGRRAKLLGAAENCEPAEATRDSSTEKTRPAETTGTTSSGADDRRRRYHTALARRHGLPTD